MPIEVGRASNGVAFLVGAAAIYEAIAAACSSPQTTEINADTRADTLMKWVHIGLIQGVLLVGVAAVTDRQFATSYIAGGAMAGVFMYGSYLYAKKAGQSSIAPGTEDKSGTGKALVLKTALGYDSAR